jgi:hypothetical protein
MREANRRGCMDGDVNPYRNPVAPEDALPPKGLSDSA